MDLVKRGMKMIDFFIRQDTDADEEFLWEMLYHAIYIPEGEPRPSRDILNEPNISQSLKGWGRKGDTALIAITADHTPIGAVWVRLFDETNKTYGYIDENTPLLGMALLPDYRGKGIGIALLGEMLKFAKESGFSKVSLSVDPNNPALHLYNKFGFKKVGVEGTSWNMVGLLK
jgi:[ribosomal protein S18]-alanine N-acetyltransferase